VPLSLQRGKRTAAGVDRLTPVASTTKQPKRPATELPKGWERLRGIKATRTVGGKRWWLCVWEGSDANGKAHPDSWEPTANVTEKAIADFTAEEREHVKRSISVDVRGLDSLVQRTVSSAMLASLHTEESGSGFGIIHKTPLPALSLKDIADYAIDQIVERFGIEAQEVYFPDAKVTRREVCLYEPQMISDFCSFETFMPAREGFGSMRFGGRKHDMDGVVVGLVKLRYDTTAHTPGCVTPEIEFHTCNLNGRYGYLTPPHLLTGYLKYEQNLTTLRQWVRANLPRSHPLIAAGWHQLAAGVHALSDPVAVPDH